MAEKTKEEMTREDKMRKDAEEKEKARMDADKRMDDKLDMLLKGIDAMRSDQAACNSRMDAWEKADKERKDAEEKARKDAEGSEMTEEERAKNLAADKTRKDAEEKEEKEEKMAADKARKDAEEKDRMDATRADSASAELLKRIESQAEQIKALTKVVQPTDADYASMVRFQARADEVYVQHGQRAPRPQVGESPLAYRRRVADELKKHSERWKDKNLTLVAADEAVFGEVEDMIYADALYRAKQPNDIGSGRIREVVRKLDSGHTVTEFYGNDAHFVTGMSRPARRVREITYTRV